MIRQLQKADIAQVMYLWLSGNEDAHAFISREYWRSHYAQVQEQILEAEVFVYETNGKIQGFIGMENGYIAGIFVDGNCRSCGIGRELLEVAKRMHSALTLDVYQRNTRAVSFYLREGFSISSEELDEAVGEVEYTMRWEGA